MTRDTRSYRHFCLLARALEQLGERWSLLIVRDLLVGPRRFTDLMDRLGGITPKTLSQRLKDLEANGLVQVDREPGRREVWYELTPAGSELRPALAELTAWGLRHNQRPRQPGEPLHPEHFLEALRVVLDRTAAHRKPTRWQFRFLDEGSYTLAFDGTDWTLAPAADADADLVVTTTSEDWARHITTPPSERPDPPRGVDVAGKPVAIRSFKDALTRFRDGA